MYWGLLTTQPLTMHSDDQQSTAFMCLGIQNSLVVRTAVARKPLVHVSLWFRHLQLNIYAHTIAGDYNTVMTMCS